MHGLMAPSDAERVTPELRADHVRFIDGLDTDNKVVTGGGLTPATGQFEGAYVVRVHVRCTKRAFRGAERGRLGSLNRLPTSSEIPAKTATPTEGEGFEPSNELTPVNGFRDRPVQPLRHPSEAAQS